MKILEVYQKYQIMPQLKEHQLRVAVVAYIICQNFDGQLDRDNIVAAALLHDMGNIIKFDLSRAETLANRSLDLAYWQKVKDGFIEKYGLDEHAASMAIATELAAGPRVLGLIDAVGFECAAADEAGDDFGKKICEYADGRVSPPGVVDLEERFADLRARYAHRHTEWGSEQKRQIYENSLRQIERQIFAHCKIKPSDITELAARPITESLKSFEI